MKYLLFVFAKHVDQEEFIKFLGGEIGRVIESSDVKYYYGPESVIFTFNSNEDSTDW